MRIESTVAGHKHFLLLAILAIGISCGAAPEPDKTVYSGISNKELKQKALALVKSIRGLVASHNKEDRELMAKYEKNNTPEIRIDEQKTMRDQWLKESDAVHDSAMRSYKESYWADAILLRNELSKRLPKKLNQKNLAPIYQNPTNVLGIRVIADDLELISKSLPDS